MMPFSASLARPRACELRRKSICILALAAAMAFAAAPVFALAPTSAQEPADHAQPAQQAAGAEGRGEHGGQGESGHEEGSIWGFVGKVVNFTLLVGTLVYFFRSPLTGYLANRRTEVRADLDAAEALKRTSAAQIAEMDAKLKALPRELEELRARGQAEISAEEARIRELAEAERVRLVEQASREIDQQVRTAQRALVEHAADLAISIAEQKIKGEITNDDQARLVKTYLDQVKTS
jgi:F-type H+-transporting ATPase subunit b